jgi:hypothetical protein
MAAIPIAINPSEQMTTDHRIRPKIEDGPMRNSAFADAIYRIGRCLQTADSWAASHAIRYLARRRFFSL